jgi:T4 RnlA family RNA ligase
MSLVDKDDSFFFVDQAYGTQLYRIFNYRLASYQQWLYPNALECRGITFQIESEYSYGGITKPIRLASFPFAKFFNHNEIPTDLSVLRTGLIEKGLLSPNYDGGLMYDNMVTDGNLEFLRENFFQHTREYSLDEVEVAYDKLDGSLISSMLTDNGVHLKSKGSLFSTQAVDANEVMNNHPALKDFVFQQTSLNRTVIMEYVSPTNRIVLHYDKPDLFVLGVRDNETGYTIPLETLDIDESISVAQGHYNIDGDEFYSTLNSRKGIEGFIFVLADDLRVKVKTDEYLVLHKLKDSINSPKALYEACVHDAIDDIKAQFYDDQSALDIIDDMEGRVRSTFLKLSKNVETFYNSNKHLERKDFAIKGQRELDAIEFSCAMNLYIGRDVDFKEVMIKQRERLGFKTPPKDLDSY